MRVRNMSFGNEYQTNLRSTHLAERCRRALSVSRRKSKESLYGQKLIDSIQKLRYEFHQKWNGEHFVDVCDVRKIQWDFWNERVLAISKENEKVFVFMNRHRTKYSPETIEMCRKKIHYFHKLANMYRDSIYMDLSRELGEMSEMTVMIGLEAIEKYRCSKFIRLWNIASWQHQCTSASDRPPTRDPMYEMEALLTHNVGEFLKVVYDLQKCTAH